MTRLFNWILVALSLAVVSAGANPPHTDENTSRRVVEILKNRSPDDVTKGEILEIVSIGEGIANGNLEVSPEATTLMLRLFTFGCEDKIGTRLDLATNLAERAIQWNPNQHSNAEFPFLRAVLLGMMAVSDKDYEEANKMLAMADMQGSEEAHAKRLQGGFADFNLGTERLERLMDSAIDSAIDESGWWFKALMGGPMGVTYFKNGMKKGMTAKALEDDQAKTIRLLQCKADAMFRNPSRLQFDPQCLLFRYDALRTASVLGNRNQDLQERKSRISILLGTQGDALLASSRMASARKTIICSENPCQLFDESDPGAIPKRKQVLTSSSKRMQRIGDDILVMPAADIKLYNQEIAKRYPGDSSKQLKFDSGHPQNGCTYVQHPYRDNEYCEISRFQWRILAEKADELRRLFVSLGATEIHTTVKYDESAFSKESKSGAIHVGANVPGGQGQIDVAANHEMNVFRKEVSRMSLDNFYVKAQKGPVVLPSGPEYPFLSEPEQVDWRTTASEVVAGRLKETTFRLAITEDYGYDEVFAASVEGAATVGIVNFDAKISGEVAESLKALRSLSWEYTVKF
ncbi:MAG: hypothetical protein ILM98_13370 [Kiritimatiellae bacterium]|nr:hypothetical protein [Kiritimatiellia bacterium]